MPRRFSNTKDDVQKPDTFHSIETRARTAVGTSVVQTSYHSSVPLTHDDVKQKIYQLVQGMKTHPDRDFRIMVAHKSPTNWRAGHLVDIKNIHSPDDVDMMFFRDYSNIEDNRVDEVAIRDFKVYSLASKKVVAGGDDDDNNDCLFYCLKLFFYLEELNPEIDTPSKLKKFCGVGRNDKIPFNELDKVAKLLKWNIQLYGTVEKTYQGDYFGKLKRTIRLKVIGSHFELAPSKNDKHKKVFNIGIEYFEKPVHFYFKFDGKYYVIDDNDIIFVLSSDGFSNKGYDSIYYDVTEKNVLSKIKSADDAVDYLKMRKPQLLKDFDEFRKATGINLIYNARSITALARSVFFQSLYQYKKTIEPVSPIESQYLKINGGLMYLRRGRYKKAFYYDINSRYPELLCRMGIPISAPDLLTIKEFPKFVKFGVYRCKVIGSHPWFRKHLNNLYSHHDLKTMQLLNINYELICDGEVNAVIYNEFATGHEIFEKYVHFFYKFKKNGVPLAKNMLNCLWGGLCEQNEKWRNTVNKDLIIDETLKEIVSIIPVDNGVSILLQDRSIPYITPFGRIGVFITSMGRYDLIKQILPYQDDIIRIHTDGLLCLKKIPELIVGEGLGEWKLEEVKDINLVAINGKI